VKTLALGVGDQWIEHASREEQLALAGVDAQSITSKISQALSEL